MCVAGCTTESILLFFFFNDTATTEIYTLSLHDAFPILMLLWPTLSSMDCIASGSILPRSSLLVWLPLLILVVWFPISSVVLWLPWLSSVVGLPCSTVIVSLL